MSGQHKWDFDTGGSQVVGSRASDRPVREAQASLIGWGEETAKWRQWVARGEQGPRGNPVTDMEWVRDVADRYGFSDLEIPAGAVLWEPGIKSIGGRCFYYPDGSWAIGLSLPRHQLEGRSESKQTLAHELLHAYLWEKHRVTGHGADFKAIARARGILRYCQNFKVLEQEDHRQLGLGQSRNTVSRSRCRFCGSPAEFQAVTTEGHLSYVCQEHFVAHGCLLGDGLGKRLASLGVDLGMDSGESRKVESVVMVLETATKGLPFDALRSIDFRWHERRDGD